MQPSAGRQMYRIALGDKCEGLQARGAEADGHCNKLANTGDQNNRDKADNDQQQSFTYVSSSSGLRNPLLWLLCPPLPCNPLHVLLCPPLACNPLHVSQLLNPPTP